MYKGRGFLFSCHAWLSKLWAITMKRSKAILRRETFEWKCYERWLNKEGWKVFPFMLCWMKALAHNFKLLFLWKKARGIKENFQFKAKGRGGRLSFWNFQLGRSMFCAMFWQRFNAARATSSQHESSFISFFAELRQSTFTRASDEIVLFNAQCK